MIKMKNIICLFVALAVMTIGASAQNHQSGRVVDKKGNPMQGVKVETNTGQSCFTDFDGNYTFDSPLEIKKVTAYCAGYVPKSLLNKKKKGKNKSATVTTQSNQTITLSKRSWVNSRPEKWQWFLGAQGLIDETGITHGMPGITFGVVKNVGLYTKAFFRMPKSDYGGESWCDYLGTGKYDTGGMSFTGGFLVRMGCPIYLNLGAGYFKRIVYIQYFDNGLLWGRPENMETNCACAEIGLNIRFESFIVNVGATVVDTSWPDEENKHYSRYYTRYLLNVGLSYCF